MIMVITQKMANIYKSVLKVTTEMEMIVAPSARKEITATPVPEIQSHLLIAHTTLLELVLLTWMVVQTLNAPSYSLSS
jgi:hypothetical protein